MSGGFNVFPCEVEVVISRGPSVAAVAVAAIAVVGVPDDKCGEAVKAVVVPRTATAPEIPNRCHTVYCCRMTMISFRVDDDEAIRTQRWADQLGIDKSELLREALQRHLARLASEQDAVTWAAQPLSPDESAISQIADWGPAEDWSDWADATR